MKNNIFITAKVPFDLNEDKDIVALYNKLGEGDFINLIKTLLRTLIASGKSKPTTVTSYHRPSESSGTTNTPFSEGSATVVDPKLVTYTECQSPNPTYNPSDQYLLDNE